MQTIGFKEFIPYLSNFDKSEDDRILEYLREQNCQISNLSPEKGKNELKTEIFRSKYYCIFIIPSLEDCKENTSTKYSKPPGLITLCECLERLKLVTCRYSKRQIKWINNRFLGNLNRQVPDIYELDSSDISRWTEDVYTKAVTIIDCYRQDQLSPFQAMEKRLHPAFGLNSEVRILCGCICL